MGGRQAGRQGGTGRDREAYRLVRPWLFAQLALGAGDCVIKEHFAERVCALLLLFEVSVAGELLCGRLRLAG